MDPATVIVSALEEGAVLRLKDSVSSVVKDACAAHKSLVVKALASRPGADVVLTRHEENPGMWQAPLKDELEKVGADRDPDIITAAEALLGLVGKASTRVGKYVIDVREFQGAQIEDLNTQNIFGTPPAC
jgi:hypothetical protein